MAVPFSENNADVNSKELPESWPARYNGSSNGSMQMAAQRLVDLFRLLDKVRLPSDEEGHGED